MTAPITYAEYEAARQAGAMLRGGPSPLGGDQSAGRVILMPMCSGSSGGVTFLAKASVSSAAPLNARFVRHPMELDAPSLIDLLGEESIDEDRVARAIEQARTLTAAASQ